MKGNGDLSRSTDSPLLNRLRLSIYGAVAVSALLLAISFALQDGWAEAAVSLVVGALGLLVEQARWARRLAGLVFVGFVILAGVSTFGGNYAWGLVAVASALVAWDLHHLRRRLGAVELIPEGSALVRRHLQRLLTAVGGGLALGVVGLFLQVNYGIGPAVVAGLVLVIALSRLVKFLRTESD